MKVLFLDIDGVVNCKSTTERVNGVIGIEPAKMALVKQIVQETGCVVVLSSSWRIYPPDLKHVYEHIDLYDITPDNQELTDRGCEVIAWLEQHPGVTVHAILDDNSDFHKEQPLFKTSWDEGLTEDIMLRVIRHLNV